MFLLKRGPEEARDGRNGQFLVLPVEVGFWPEGLEVVLVFSEVPLHCKLVEGPGDFRALQVFAKFDLVLCVFDVDWITVKRDIAPVCSCYLEDQGIVGGQDYVGEILNSYCVLALLLIVDCAVGYQIFQVVCTLPELAFDLVNLD